MAKQGIPASVVEKTNLSSLRVLFSMGIIKGKWRTLVAKLMSFRQHCTHGRRASVPGSWSLQGREHADHCGLPTDQRPSFPPPPD